jgi:hypothetical protein
MRKKKYKDTGSFKLQVKEASAKLRTTIRCLDCNRRMCMRSDCFQRFCILCLTSVRTILVNAPAADLAEHSGWGPKLYRDSA